MANSKKRILVLLAVLLLTFSAITATVLFATNESGSDVTPSLETVSYNLSYSDSVYILYAIANDGFDREEHEIKLLFWEEPQADYVLGTETYSASNSGKATVKGKDTLVFYSRGIAAKEMADDIFCRPCVEIGGKVYYGETVKFSVLEYVEAQKENGATGDDLALFNAMLNYGSAAQTSFNYNTGRPANAEYFKLSVIGGTLSDGFTSGRFNANETVTVTAPAKSGEQVFSHWENSDGESVSAEMSFSFSLSSDEVYTAIYEACTEHTYVEHVLVRPTPSTKGSSNYICSRCGDNYTADVGTTLKLLAIGNSFSEDSLAHLYLVAKDAGIENVVIGHLYKGGCSLETHWGAMNGGTSVHTFMLASDTGAMKVQSEGADRSVVGETSTTYYYRPEYVISYTDWDYITLQQVSGSSGLADTYSPYLENIIDFVNQNKTNENAKLFWHMTWAYQANSTKTEFAQYNKDQMTMYNGILNAVSTKILTNSNFAGVIPSGTSIQNLRTSHLGDTLTRDGYHLEKGIGRYTASLTWLAALTGIDISDIDYVPSSYTAIGEHLDCIKDAVKKAIAKPYEVTESAYPMPDSLLETTLSPLTDEDRTYLTSNGYDPDAYMLLDLSIVKGYYNSTSKNNDHYRILTSGDYGKYKFLATQIFTRNELVNGTLIRVKSGYAYRPDAWVEEGVKNTYTRPDNVSTELVTVNNAWWNTGTEGVSYNYRAFNIYSTDYNSDAPSSTSITVEEGYANFKIYIPVASKSELTEADREYLYGLGVNPNDYLVLDYTYTLHGYYNASNANPFSISTGTSTLHGQFICTNEKFTRYDIPIGSIIYIPDTNYRYRAEGWITPDAKVASDDRPLRITAQVTVVDYSWWADWGYRAFNIQTKNEAVMEDPGEKVLLRIYVPVERDYIELSDEDKAYLTELGLNADEYKILNYDYTVSGFYDASSNNGSNLNTTHATLSKKYIGTEIFTREDLTNGTVIRITETGYQYRPEGWIELTQKVDKGNRPSQVNTESVIIDDSWWGDWNYRAFNISATDGHAITNSEAGALKIYVKVA